MNKPYAIMIDEELAMLQQRIEELLITKHVISGYADDRTKGTGASQPMPLALTDTRPKVSHKKKPASELVRSRGPHIQKILIELITRILTESHEPLRSGAIIEKLEEAGTNVDNKQRVWAALSAMKERSILHHNVEERTYALVLADEPVTEKTDDDATQAG